MIKNRVVFNRFKFKEKLYNFGLMAKKTEMNLKIILQSLKNNFKFFKINFKKLRISRGVTE